MTYYRYWWLFGLLNLCASGAAKVHALTAPISEPSQQMVIEQGDDWGKLDSGRTLKGELTGKVEQHLGFYKQATEFDSSDLDEQNSDLDDNVRLKSANPLQVLFYTGKMRRSASAIQDEALNIDAKKSIVLLKDQAVFIYRGVETELARWNSNIFIGSDFNKDNTDELSIVTYLDTEHKIAVSRLLLSYAGNITKIDGEKTAENHQFDGSYDINLTPRFFFRPVKMAIDSDKFNNIDYRANASMQLGYFLFVQSNLEWDISLGPGFQYTRFDTVQEGESVDESSPTVLMTSKIDYALTETIEISHTYALSWTVNAAGVVRQRNNLGLDIEMIEDLDLSIKLVWDHQSDPKANFNDITLEKSDYKLNAGITFNF